ARVTAESIRTLIDATSRGAISPAPNQWDFIMKKYLASASLIAGLSMLSAPAFAQTTGNVGVNYTRADFGSGDTDAYGVSGQASIPMSGNLAVLVDGAYTHNDDADVDTVLADAHLISRDASMAWGGFVGIANIDAGGSSTAYGI